MPFFKWWNQPWAVLSPRFASMCWAFGGVILVQICSKCLDTPGIRWQTTFSSPSKNGHQEAALRGSKPSSRSCSSTWDSRDMAQILKSQDWRYSLIQNEWLWDINSLIYQYIYHNTSLKALIISYGRQKPRHNPILTQETTPNGPSNVSFFQHLWPLESYLHKWPTCSSWALGPTILMMTFSVSFFAGFRERLKMLTNAILHSFW